MSRGFYLSNMKLVYDEGWGFICSHLMYHLYYYYPKRGSQERETLKLSKNTNATLKFSLFTWLRGGSSNQNLIRLKENF